MIRNTSVDKRLDLKVDDRVHLNVEARDFCYIQNAQTGSVLTQPR